MPTLTITRQDIHAQPVLFVRRRIARHELTNTLAECFGKVFNYGQKAGLPIAGWPFARYVSTGVGLWTIEAGMPLAAPAAAAEGEFEAGFLPGSAQVALGVHAGPYEDLQ